MVRVRAETESVFDDGVHRVGGQSEFGPVQITSQQELIPKHVACTHIGVTIRAYSASLFKNML